MSAATETTPVPAATEPHVAETTSSVEPSETFKDAHTGESKDATSTEPAVTSEIKPQEGAKLEEPATKEEKVGKKEAKITATPITNGNLGYKAPGLMR